MSKIIYLGKTKYFAVIDDEDFESLNTYKWYASSRKDAYVYASRRIPTGIKKKYILALMHREIMQAENIEHVDHINHNTLDNRKTNLRKCSHSDNSKNRVIYKNNTSGFKGVSWCKFQGKWHARITVNSRRIGLGYFERAEDAAKAYNIAAKNYHQAFALENQL